MSSYVRTLLDKLAVARLLGHQAPDVHVEFRGIVASSSTTGSAFTFFVRSIVLIY